MEVNISNNHSFKISNIIEADDYIIKEYRLLYNFIKNIVENEIRMNKVLLNRGIVYVPKLVKVEEGLNVIKLYFEKINGNTLSSIKFTNLEIDIKMDIFYRILNFIKLLHLNNIVHNDLSLSNFILSDDNKLYLIDFALSDKLNNQNRLNDLHSLNEIIKKIFEVEFKLISKNIHRYMFRFGEVKYELLYKRRIRNKRL